MRPVRELVTGRAAVLCHHREDEPAAISEQRAIDIRIVLADRGRHVGEVGLFDTQQQHSEAVAIDEGERDMMVEDLKELRKFLEELYNQLED